MDRESHHDTGVIMNSSIALLQERFKQLQRVKAMRAQRDQVLTVLPLSVPTPSTTKSMDPNMGYQGPASLFFHPQPELVPAHGHGFRSPYPEVSLSLSLWPTLKTEYEEEDYIHIGTESQLLINLWPTVTSSPSSNSTSSNNFEDLDTDCDSDGVDTSLHL